MNKQLGIGNGVGYGPFLIQDRGEQAGCGAAETGAAAGLEERAYYFPGWG
jgi:hypothetical protein